LDGLTDEAPLKLKLKGIFLDTIQRVSTIKLVSRSELWRFQNSLHDIMPLECKLDSTREPRLYFNGEAMFDAFWRSLIFDEEFLQRHTRIATKNLPLFRKGLVSLLTEKKLSLIARPGQKVIPHNSPPSSPELETTKKSIIMGFDRACNFCTFGMTEKSYMARLPNEARKGDILSVLYGARTPHVDRHRIYLSESGSVDTVGFLVMNKGNTIMKRKSLLP
jgi:hypothetical protein